MNDPIQANPEPAQNPYAAPSEVGESDPYQQAVGDQEQLAGRFTRLAAAIVDGILVMLIIFPIQLSLGFVERAQLGTLGILEQLIMTAVGFLAMLLLHGYLLAKRGQTIGKFLTKIQIVDFQSNHLVPLSTILIFRYLWILPFTLLVIFIPGQTDDTLVQLVTFVDVILIFRSDRRCLHDLIAGTHVVEYRADRAQLGTVAT